MFLKLWNIANSNQLSKYVRTKHLGIGWIILRDKGCFYNDWNIYEIRKYGLEYKISLYKMELSWAIKSILTAVDSSISAKHLSGERSQVHQKIKVFYNVIESNNKLGVKHKQNCSVVSRIFTTISVHLLTS